MEMLLPTEYVSSVSERLALYTELDDIETEEDLEKFQYKLKDRFGKVPPQVHELFEGLRLRWICRELGFERVILKNNKLRCYFVENPQSRFYESETFKSIMQFISTQGESVGLRIKQSPRHLLVIKENVRSLKQARGVLRGISEAIVEKEPV